MRSPSGRAESMTRGVAPVATRTTSALTLCCVVSVVTSTSEEDTKRPVPLMISTPTSRTRVSMSWL